MLILIIKGWCLLMTTESFHEQCLFYHCFNVMNETASYSHTVLYRCLRRIGDIYITTYQQIDSPRQRRRLINDADDIFAAAGPMR